MYCTPLTFIIHSKCSYTQNFIEVFCFSQKPIKQSSQWDCVIWEDFFIPISVVVLEKLQQNNS